MLNNSVKYACCQYCDKEFKVSAGSTGKFCSLSCSTANKNKISRTIRKNNYILNPIRCSTCNNVLDYDKRNNKFCSNKCAAIETNKVVRKRGPDKKTAPYCKVEYLWCEKTNQWYLNKNEKGFLRKCSPYVKSTKEEYYSKARFRFNVYDYPDEFDLNLIEHLGWYTCPGKKRKNLEKNVSGVSRDHIISVSYGYQHNIDPSIISHPANCRIIRHSENKKKSDSCNITLTELESKINSWNKKYTEQATGLEPATNGLEGRHSTN